MQSPTTSRAVTRALDGAKRVFWFSFSFTRNNYKGDFSIPLCSYFQTQHYLCRFPNCLVIVMDFYGLLRFLAKLVISLSPTFLGLTLVLIFLLINQKPIKQAKAIGFFPILHGAATVEMGTQRLFQDALTLIPFN